MVKATEAVEREGSGMRKILWGLMFAFIVALILTMGSIALAVTSVDGFNDTLMAILASQSETNNALLRALEMILP